MSALVVLLAAALWAVAVLGFMALIDGVERGWTK